MHIASVNSILDSRKRKAIQECYGLVTRIYKGIYGRLRLKCDGTRTETRFRLSAKRTSPFKSAGVSVQSTTGSRGVRISGSNAGYTKFRVSVKGTGYPLHSPFSPSLPLPASPCAISFQKHSTSIPHFLPNVCLFLAPRPPVGHGLIIIEVSRSHRTHHSR